jgi:hypothetical protein
MEELLSEAEIDVGDGVGSNNLMSSHPPGKVPKMAHLVARILRERTEA